jgi:hypothetical protein
MYINIHNKYKYMYIIYIIVSEVGTLQENVTMLHIIAYVMSSD